MLLYEHSNNKVTYITLTLTVSYRGNKLVKTSEDIKFTLGPIIFAIRDPKNN